MNEPSGNEQASGEESAGERRRDGAWEQARPPGCILKPALVGAAALTAGAYLMGRWEHLGGMGRAGSVVLVLIGALAVLPVLVIMLAMLAKFYFMRKLDKSLGGVLGAGREMVERNKALFGELHETRDATDADFAQLDRGWYEATSRELAELGYRHLGDTVNVTIEQATGMTTVIRVFASADGTTAAGIYHLPLAKSTARLEGKKLLTVEFESEFNDGTFAATSNTAETDLTTPPPAIHRSRHPLDTPVRDLAAAHDKEKANLLAAKSGAECVTFETLADVLESQQRENQAKAAFRKNIGFIDPEEVRRIANASSPQDELKATLAAASADIARKDEQRKSRENR